MLGMSDFTPKRFFTGREQFTGSKDLLGFVRHSKCHIFSTSRILGLKGLPKKVKKISTILNSCQSSMSDKKHRIYFKSINILKIH